MKNNFVQTKDGNFNIDGKPFRFIGCNMYELANVDTTTIRKMINDASSEGFKVIRFWAFHPVTKEKMIEICEMVRPLNIKIIPVLSDLTGYLQSFKITDGWFKDGYKKEYMCHVIDVTSALKDREEILLWELINEPQADSFRDFYKFAKDVSEKIKALDPNHLLSIGTIGGIGDRFGNFISRFKISNFRKLYEIKSIDAVSIHDYSFNSNLFERLDVYYRFSGNKKYSDIFNSLGKFINYIPDKIDKVTLNKLGETYDFITMRKIWRNYNLRNILIAKELNKPVYIGEVGFKKNLGELRRKIVDKELKKYFEQGISGVLLWSFESQGRSQDGHDYGFGTSELGVGNLDFPEGP